MTSGILVMGNVSLAIAYSGKKETIQMLGNFSVPQKKIGVIIQKNSAGQRVVLTPQKERLALNETAEFIWNNIDGKHTSLDLANLLVDKFQISNEQALNDTMTLLKNFERENILEIKQVACVYVKKIRV